jgi:hypothetical protein
LTSPIQLDVTAISAYIDEDFELNTYQWSLFEGIVERLNEEVEAAGGKLLVMLLPFIINPREIETMTGGTFERRFETPAGLVTIRSAEPRERLAKLSQRLDIPLLDPTQDFIDFISENELLEATWPDATGRHFSEVVHRFLADWLNDHSEGWAPAGQEFSLHPRSTIVRLRTQALDRLPTPRLGAPPTASPRFRRRPRCS